MVQPRSAQWFLDSILTRALDWNGEWMRWGMGGVAIASTLFLSLPTTAAEHIHFKYDDLDITFSVETLDTYAKLGHVEEELKGYIALLPTRAQADLRRLLQTPFPIEALELENVLKAPMGQMMLTEVGRIIQTQSGANGAMTLQTALNLAAKDSGGLTLISLMHHLQADVRVDLKQVFRLLEQRDVMRKQAHVLVQEMQPSRTTTEASWSKSDRLTDLRLAGKLGVLKETVTATYTPQHFSNEMRSQRQVTADLYRPNRTDDVPASVIVMSHGLGGNRDSHLHFAQHLASHGFAVVVVQHPGSDKEQSKALLQGRSPHLFDFNAFIDRPSDITHLLNELEKQNQTDSRGRLNLQQVGIFGHSFGGYTALALAGAEIDFAQVAQNCSTQSFLLNPSLLLQCRALELPRKAYQFRDPRVQAILIINPVNASVFGRPSLQQISIPVLWATGTEDVVTPLETEHIPSFQALTTHHKYLGVVEGARHGASPMSMASVAPGETPSDSSVLDDYLNAVGLAFMQVHVQDDDMYRSYLQPAYAQSISREPYQLNFMPLGIDTSTSHQFNSPSL